MTNKTSIKTLITTGCSFTEIPIQKFWDLTYVDVDSYPQYSISWPVHLNNVLNTTPNYKGKGASGNGIISRTTIYEVKTALEKYKPEEILVGIMWSGAQRHEIYLSEPPVNFHKMYSGDSLKNSNNPAYVVDEPKFYKIMPHWNDELSKTYYKYFFDDQGSHIQTLEHILRTQWYLKLTGVKYFMTCYHAGVLPTAKMLENPEIKYLHDLVDFSQFLDVDNCWNWCTRYEDPKLWDPKNKIEHHPHTKQYKAFTDYVIIPHIIKKGWINEN